MTENKGRPASDNRMVAFRAALKGSVPELRAEALRLCRVALDQGSRELQAAALGVGERAWHRLRTEFPEIENKSTRDGR